MKKQAPHRPRLLSFMAALLLAATTLLLSPRPAPANVSAAYGVLVTPQGQRLTYITKLPVGARPIYFQGRRYYLANGVYYEPQMLRGRVVYIAVDKTWQR